MGRLLSYSFVRPIQRGMVTLNFDRETKELASVTAKIGEFDKFIAAMPNDALHLFRVLQAQFQDANGADLAPRKPDDWRNPPERNSWTFIGPIHQKPEVYWLSAGPLSFWIATDVMRQIYQDFAAAVQAWGGWLNPENQPTGKASKAAARSVP